MTTFCDDALEGPRMCGDAMYERIPALEGWEMPLDDAFYHPWRSQHLAVNSLAAVEQVRTPGGPRSEAPSKCWAGIQVSHTWGRTTLHRRACGIIADEVCNFTVGPTLGPQ